MSKKTSGRASTRLIQPDCTAPEPLPVRRCFKIAIVLVILGIGLGTAILFRRRETLPAAAIFLPSSSLTLRASEAGTPNPDSSASAWSRRQAEKGRAAPLPLEMVRIPAALSAGGLTHDSLPPQLSARYQGNFESLALSPPGRPSYPAAPLPIRKLPSDPERPRDVQRTHKIVDGDTLSLLARRYLGRRDRYLELYEANRDVLKTPDILPIGVVLKIPPRRVPPPIAGPRRKLSPIQTQPARNAKVKPESLVPVPPGALRQHSK